MPSSRIGPLATAVAAPLHPALSLASRLMLLMMVPLEYTLSADVFQRGMNPNSKSAGNAQRFQLPATAPYHREVVSRGSQQAFVRPSDGCADAEASLVGPYPADACRPPSVPCGVGAGPTRWPAIPTWQPPDGHAPPPTRTSPAIRRPPRMGTRWPIHLLPT